jgi:hypothetical protein
LHEALVLSFGQLPSAAKFADAFNLRAHGTSTISRETARKWLRGDALPEISKMRVLISWLQLDPASFLQPLAQEQSFVRKTTVDLFASSPSIIRETLIRILPDLDDKSLEALYLTAVAMEEVKKKRSNANLEESTKRQLTWN